MIEASPIWGVVEVVVLVGLILAGVHIFIALGLVGCTFAVLYIGSTKALSLIGLTAWMESASYTLSMIPLFILMGALVARCGLGRDSYDAIMRWLGKTKGGLAIVSNWACALFGTVTGSSQATIATIGGIGIPEMTRYGYSKSLRTGSVASASILSNLIPPSLVAIFYSIFTDVSIGKLFIAGIIPGIILAILYSAVIYTWVTLRPSAAPKVAETYSFKEKVIGLRTPIPILVIFGVLISGIYLGWFTPTEAAAMGSSTVLAVVLIMRRLTWQRFKEAIGDTLRMTAMIMYIVVGAFIYSHTIVMTGIGNAVGDVVVALGLGPLALVWIVIVVFIVAGCVLEVFSMMVLFIPLFFPMVTGMGWSPVWFGTLCVMLVEIALITPPFAGNIYITQLLDPEASVWDIIKGVFPFYSAAFGLLALLVFFPQIALWLPGMMIGG